jgi:hypothetical protein
MIYMLPVKVRYTYSTYRYIGYIDSDVYITPSIYRLYRWYDIYITVDISVISMVMYISHRRYIGYIDGNVYITLSIYRLY